MNMRCDTVSWSGGRRLAGAALAGALVLSPAAALAQRGQSGPAEHADVEAVTL